ncbi:myosin class II heavy chain [Arthroderma uncinatum]|uniref:myosin class II heavy chain n=1 Tax=Arthroderma uncinatum TaxID=74035 RepID=UPI00144A68DB|nr:myosin class II heavy chain [Arthroderma uncinatum]KAF3480181.1 myosin class II heavy chain [Arthroderma uncinatum]
MAVIGIRSTANTCASIAGSTLAVNSSNPIILQPSHHQEEESENQEHTLTLRRSVTPGAVSSIAAGTSSPQQHQTVPSAFASLAVPSGYRGTSDAQSSTFSPDNKRTDTSAYYTAAWGSPYATPSSRRLSWQLRSRQGDFESELETSPFSIRTTGQEQERLETGSEVGAVPFPELTSTLFERDLQTESVSRNRGKSIKDFTQDWINQYLTGKPRSERTNWLSDDSGESDVGSFLTAYQQRAEESEGWLDLDDKEDLLKTPTSSKLFKGKKPEYSWKSRPAHLKANHAPKASTATLKQSDFWDFGHEPEPESQSQSQSQQSQSESQDEESGSVTMSNLEPLTIPEVRPPPQQYTYVSPTDKPLPLPPTPVEDALDQPQGGASKQTIRTAAAFVRPKKKIPWRGKQCVIALPLVDTRGSENGGVKLLTPADMEQILDKWEDEGYDVRGTGRGEPVAVDLQNRQTHPDPAESRREFEQSKYTVSFPDQSVWEEYVDFLKEEKLRALGVSLGDPEPNPIMSPTPGAMSRNSSQLPIHPGHTISPPIPTSSAGSNHLSMMQNPFSPAFNQSTKATSNISSMNSPSSPFGFHTDSPFQQFQTGYGNEASYPFLPFQPTPPTHGTHSPQNLYGIRPGGMTPSNMGNMPNLGSLLHSVSPLADESKQFPGMASMMGHSHFNNPYTVGTPLGRANEFENPMQQQPLPLDESNMDMEADDDTIQSNNSGPEIAHPTPRGHRHNVSETLQKGVEREYQLENHGVDNGQRVEDDLMNSRWAAPGEQPMGQHSFFQSESINQSNRLQQHIFDEEQAHKGARHDEASDLETNPSIKDSRSPANDYHQGNNHEAKHSTGSAFIPGHKSTSSISKLNVAAKAFDPSIASFSSNNFSFMPNNNFQPSFGGFDPRPALPPSVPQSISHSAHSSGFNVAAPAFAPVPKPQQPVSTPSNFKFSSATFNVAAPVFSPGASFNLPTTQKPSPSSTRTKIFDNFDPSAIIPPAKASKAIPIVRPGENENNEPSNDQMEGDASGRFGAQGREKRVRRVESQGGEHSDAQELMFAMSPAAADSKRTAAVVEDSDVPTEIAENRKRTEDKIIETILSAPEESEELEEGEIREDNTTVAKPFEFKNSQDAADFSNAHPSVLGDDGVIHDREKVESEPAQGPEAAVEEDGSVDQEEQDTIVEDGDQDDQESTVEEVTIEHKSSVLKPTAKPFEFVPSEPPVRSISPVVSPVQTPVSPPPKKQGLYASRYAVSVSPEPTEKKSALTAGLKATGQAEQPPAENPNSSDEEEIDAVMKQLNDGDSNVGVERLGTPPPQPVFHDNLNDAVPQLAPSYASRSNAPSPSLRAEPWQPEFVQKETIDHMLPPSALLAQRSPALDAQSPIRQLNTQPQDHISDWDDAISSGEDEELRQRAPFFETHVKDIVQTSIGEHLAPVERILSGIQQSITLMGTQNLPQPHKSLSARVEHSDADDEDDEEEGGHRSRSPWNKRDKLAEKIKSIVTDALAAHHQPVQQEVAPNVDLSEITFTLAAIKTAIASVSQQQSQSDDIRDMISRSISEHPALLAMQSTDDKPDLAPEMEKLKLQVDGLQSMLRLADERADQEYNARRAAQDSLAIAQRQMELAEKEAATEREARLAAEEALELLKSQHLPQMEQSQQHSRDLKEQQDIMRLTLSELSDKNIDLQGTLDEYRVSADQARADKEKAEAENKDLRRTLEILKIQTEEGADVKEKLRERFERLQGDVTTLTKDIAQEQALWRKKEVEANIKYNTLMADFTRESKQRQKLELHINDLEQKEMEATKLRYILDQSQNENDKLEELLMNVRQESHDHQTRAARFEREAKEAVENSHFEAERVRVLLEADLNAANHQVNFVRTELEAQISNVQSQLDNARMDSETAKARYELLLAEARDSKLAALHDASESKESAIQDQRRLHERTLNDLRERHARAMHNTSEDRQRDEAHYMEVVALRDEKIEHLQEKVAHIEEKLEIAKSAARAAAEAAQSAKAAPVVVPQPPTQTTAPSMTYAQGSEVPDRISPQALRESIMVLQDQLQQREGRIEELEHELSTMDKDAPMKIKEKETEINWLRELLSVRVDDLRDLIRALSQPSFDQHSVRDAAIRLRANLQMQQQEKERAMSGGNQQFPSLASLTSLASSPRTLPLAAAAAWGNWRKGNNNPPAASTATSSSGSSGGDQLTPSKPSKPMSASQGFLSGLMTPPSSNTRDTPVVPPAPIGRRTYSESRPLRGQNAGIHRLSSRQLDNIMAPTTPPLLRTSSYDHDAETMHYGAGGPADDNDNDSVIGGLLGREPGIRPIEGPFGPEI